MRGAWKAGYEYISELRTKRPGNHLRYFESLVGCDGSCTRYRARVSAIWDFQAVSLWSVLEEAGGASCL
ncbi:hypothetical protein [Enterocloster sp.]|uniref:Uncharacterized protein n=1 Tax=Enterocloster alcoholdehydrogenati TaxID=2547410 RepID=A0ABQ0AVL2_9FIRM